MKKSILLWLLAGSITVLLGGCERKQTAEEILKPSAAEGVVSSQAEESTKETTETDLAAASEEGEEETVSQETEASFSFQDFRNLEFSFCSGAGGWQTLLMIDDDGSFSGEYYDGELGSIGDDYPDGTMYLCDFYGQFTEPVRVNDYTYSMKIREINYEKEVGTEEIRDGIRYCYTDVYGLDGAEEILIYLPGAPLAELSEEFRSWIGYYDLSNTQETELPFYALNNEAQQYGFTSYDIAAGILETIAATELSDAELTKSIQEDPLTQTELNEKTGVLYGMWDSVLNQLWSVLKQTQDAETMEALLAEQRQWISEKEKAVADAGAAYEGGSMQEMVKNQKAAERTKERVYELAKYLK